ncbi:FAD:protein FMN transferase [Paucibacter sp. O1-1]|nr:FAD:protein FMN transferase [Paucibacter sp. O1-1]MDA3831135.1 FAD:protein FMN transferase [Paucibacter sp. O1-1]
MLVTAAWLRPALADPRVVQQSRVLMGTRVEITVEGRTAASSGAALAAAWAEMARQADLMSRYRADNAVRALQLAAGLQPVVVAPELMQVLKTARQVSEYSNGAFDITVGAFSGWGFDPAQTVIPSADEIRRQLSLVNYRDVLIDESGSRAYLRRRGMRIDLGGIAKLPILEAGLRVLQSRGLAGAMINGGGDVLVSGQLQGRDWRIGLLDPRAPRAPQGLLGLIALSDGVVAASGDYERCFVRDGRRYHHILDPRSGQPSSGVRGVALVARRVADLNGLGTALMVGGRRREHACWPGARRSMR